MRDATRQVHDYARTLDGLIPRAVGEGTAMFTPELVSELHRAVMQSDPRYADVPGTLRTHVV